MRRLLAGRRPRVKLSSNEIMRRLRLGDLHKLFADRYRGQFPEGDDSGREDLRELLLPISLSPYWDVMGPREIRRWAPWMSAAKAQELMDEIELTPKWQRRPMARTLGRRLNVTYAERARLGLRTIGPCDITEAGMAAIRKQKKRQRARLRRQLAGAQSRAEYLAASLSKTRPWEALGISKRTYYNRIKNGTCTSPYPINLTVPITGYTLVQTVKAGEGSEECGRVSTPTPARLTGTCAIEGICIEGTWFVDHSLYARAPKLAEAA